MRAALKDSATKDEEKQDDKRAERASRKRQSRRRRILDEARGVFAERGYHQTHVSDIIAAAEIARGTFYLYFDSKSAIFLELLDELLDELKESINGVDTRASAPPVEAQLVTIVGRLLRTLAQNRSLTRIIVREAVGLDKEVDEKLVGFYSDLLHYIREALDNGKRMGLLRDFDTGIASFCVLGTIKQFMEQLVTDEGDQLTENLDRLALALLDFNLRGLLKPARDAS